MDGVVGCRTTAAELEGVRAEAADDEGSVAVGSAVEQALGRGSEVVACDNEAVGVRVRVEVHEFRLSEGGGDGVVARGAVLRVPVRCGGAGGDADAIGLRCELRVVYGLALLRGVVVDFALPAWNGDASAGDGASHLLGWSGGRLGRGGRLSVAGGEKTGEEEAVQRAEATMHGGISRRRIS